MINKSMLAMLVTGVGTGMAWMIAGGLYRRHELRRVGMQVNEWEGEGGNVPEVPTVAPRNVSDDA